MMVTNWTLTLLCLLGIFILGGECSQIRRKPPMGPIGFQDQLTYLVTPFTNDVRDRDLFAMPAFASHSLKCEGSCPPLERKKRVSHKIPSEDLLDGHGNPQAVLSTFPTPDPLREKKNKNQRNKFGKGNRSQKSNGLKENNAVLAGGELHKSLGLNNASEKRGRKKFTTKKAPHERRANAKAIAAAHAA